MPKEAIKLGAVDAVVPLSEVAQTVIHTIKDQ
jgi:chemotaxis response regulator CheB